MRSSAIRMLKTKALSVAIMLSVTACSGEGAGLLLPSPFTATPAAVLGVYELSGKRAQWQKYAEGGDVYAMYELGKSYAEEALQGGINGEKAMHWYCQAARNGYVKAQLVMGQLYEGKEKISGLEVTKDYARAMMWYRQAAKRVGQQAQPHIERVEKLMSAQDMRDAAYLSRAPKRVPCGPEPLAWQE